MREIKFRIWNSYPKQMNDWGSVKGKFNLNIFESDLAEYHVMQYTGLKDKNGKEIYEGDIVFINRGDSLRSINQEVIFNPFVGFCTFRELKGFEEFQHLDLGYFGEDRIEVIGNIYENPDLLEVNDGLR